jgi:hypothetical protein
MARIPFAQIQGGVVSVDAPPLRPADVQADPSAGVAQLAIARDAAIGADVTDKFLQARNTVAVSKSVLESVDQLDKYRTELESDPDYASRVAKFGKRMAEVRNQQMEKLFDGRAQDDFNVRFDTQARTMQMQVRHQARDEEVQDFRVKLGESLDQLATRSVMAKSDPERQALQAEASAAITDAVRTGRMSAVQAHSLSRAYLNKVDAALATEMIRANPSGAIGALGDPERFKYLDASARVQLRSLAQQRAESLGAQARAELRADIHDFTSALVAGQPVAQEDKEKLVARAGAKSPAGALLNRTWDFYQRVNTEGADKSIPQLAATIGNITSGAPLTHDNYPARQNPDGTVSTQLGITVTDQRLNGGKPTNIPSLWGGQEVDQGEAISRALRSGRAFPSFDTIDEAVAASVDESRQIGQRLSQPPKPATPQDLHLARVLKTTLARKIAERDHDPAAYALKYYPTVNESLLQAQGAEQSNDAMAKEAAPEIRNGAWSTMVEVQRKEGVPEHKIALLTKLQADALRNQLLTAEGQQRVDLVDTLRGQYGEQWGRVKAQLSQGHELPPDIEVLGSLPQGANLPKVMIAEAMKVSDKQATEILGGQKMGDIDKAVRTASADMATTMVPAPGGAEKLATFQTAAEKLARLYVMRGESDANAAAKRATADVFYDHWEPLDTLRIPKAGGEPIVPASAVRATQRQVIEALPKLDLMLPPADKGVTAAAAKDALVRNVRSFGQWLTTADDKGMVLMAGPGLPVRFADGKPLIVPFDSVLAAAGNQAAASNLQSRQVLNAAAGAGSGEPVDLGTDAGPPAAGHGLPSWLIRSQQALPDALPMFGTTP